MRRLFAVVILLCVTYFLGGWLAVYLGWLPKDIYFAYAGLVGGLASVTGLFTLTRPSITQTDVQAIEMEALKSMAVTATQLQALEVERSRTKQEIGGLEVKRQEMELLVKKASLALFLKEQHDYHEKQVLEELERNNPLREHLRKAEDASQKLHVLNEEIESHPNVAQLKQIIASARRQPVTIDAVLRDLPFPFAILSRSLLLLNRAISNLFMTIK